MSGNDNIDEIPLYLNMPRGRVVEKKEKKRY
jgi:hypothetical protein